MWAEDPLTRDSYCGFLGHGLLHEHRLRGCLGTGGLHEMRAKVTEALIAGADSIIIAGALSTELGHMTGGQSRPAHRSGSGGSFL